jgi:hypothetical protein
MSRARTFGVLQYEHGVWDGCEPLRVDASSYEEALQKIVGGRLKLVACSRIRSLYHLTAKVWDGNGFRYAYRY